MIRAFNFRVGTPPEKESQRTRARESTSKLFSDTNVTRGNEVRRPQHFSSRVHMRSGWYPRLHARVVKYCYPHGMRDGQRGKSRKIMTTTPIYKTGGDLGLWPRASPCPDYEAIAIAPLHNIEGKRIPVRVTFLGDTPCYLARDGIFPGIFAVSKRRWYHG